MTKVNNWSIVGYIIGLVIAIGSYVRYWVIWNDPSQGGLYVFVGAVICALAWIYNELGEQKKTMMAIEDYLSDKNSERGDDEK